MKSRLVEGKTIRKVHQARFLDSNQQPAWSIEAIEFTDGSVLRFLTIEGDGEYGLAGIYPGLRPGAPTSDEDNES